MIHHRLLGRGWKWPITLYAIVASLGTALHAADAPPTVSYYHWDWSAKEASVNWCAKLCPDPYAVRLDENPASREVKITVNLADQVLLEWKGHDHSVFKFSNDRVYRIEFAASSGGNVIAFDLKAQKELWQSRLQALGPVAHSIYHNQINLRIEENRLIILGDESYGRYVEAKDAATGQTLTTTIMWRRLRPLPNGGAEAVLADAPHYSWRWDDALANKPLDSDGRHFDPRFDRDSGRLFINGTDMKLNTPLWERPPAIVGFGPTGDAAAAKQTQINLRVEDGQLMIYCVEPRGWHIESRSLETALPTATVKIWRLEHMAKDKPGSDEHR